MICIICTGSSYHAYVLYEVYTVSYWYVIVGRESSRPYHTEYTLSPGWECPRSGQPWPRVTPPDERWKPLRSLLRSRGSRSVHPVRPNGLLLQFHNIFFFLSGVAVAISGLFQVRASFFFLFFSVRCFAVATLQDFVFFFILDFLECCNVMFLRSSPVAVFAFVFVLMLSRASIERPRRNRTKNNRGTKWACTAAPRNA